MKSRNDASKKGNLSKQIQPESQDGEKPDLFKQGLERMLNRNLSDKEVADLDRVLSGLGSDEEE
jgi:hypothetical protein